MFLGKANYTFQVVGKKNMPSLRGFASPSGGEYITPKSVIPTYHFQKSLPRLPIPELKDSVGLYLKIVEPVLTTEQFAKTKKVVEDFGKTDGPRLHEKLKSIDKANKHTSYISGPWYDMYLRGRYSVAVNSNPFMIFNDFPDAKKNTQLARAASFIRSSLRFKRSLEEKVLEPEVYHMGREDYTPLQKKLLAWTPESISWYHSYYYKSYPLDMSQYSRLFATTRIPHPERDEIVTHTGQRHVVVMRGPHFYKMEVLNADGSAKSTGEILSSLNFILQDPQSTQPGPAVGALTAEDRTVWANARAELIKDSLNKESLDTIDKALFVVCLDDWESNDSEFVHHQFLHGNGTNRNFDKSFSLLVSKDGKTSVNFEHSWGDGVAVLRYMNEIYRDAIREPVPSFGNIQTPPVKLNWNINPTTQASIDKATSNLKGVISSLEFKTRDFKDYGKYFLKGKNVSPDGTIQMAYQLAYNRMYGKTVTTYESASTAGFLHGRTETIRPASMESVKMVELFNNPKATPSERYAALKKAIEAHSAYVRKASLGTAVDRHFFALLDLAKKEGKIPEIFQDEAYKIINHNILSTSTLVSDAIQGGGFGPVVGDGYGIGYGVHPEGQGIRFNITSYGLKTETFLDHISESLLDIKKVLNGDNLSLKEK